jgi:hypothetical protein
MIWTLMGVAEKSWRKLNAPELLKDVHAGKRFEDGLAVIGVRSEQTATAA